MGIMLEVWGDGDMEMDDGFGAMKVSKVGGSPAPGPIQLTFKTTSRIKTPFRPFHIVVTRDKYKVASYNMFWNDARMLIESFNFPLKSIRVKINPETSTISFTRKADAMLFKLSWNE